MNEFAGKHVIVTGGALGIGKTIVESFALQGAKVIFADFNEQAGIDTQDTICKQLGVDTVRFFPCDLSQEQDLRKFTADALSAMQHVDILVNNVGAIRRSGNILSHTIRDFEYTFRLNVYSSIHCIQTFLPSMRSKGKGSIVNISSTMALGTTGFTAYSVSKGSLNALTKSLALDFARDGIRVNSVAPGAIITPLTRSWADRSPDPAAEKGIPMGRLGTPREVADAVLFLSSERASYITGHVLTVDGGMTAGE